MLGSIPASLIVFMLAAFPLSGSNADGPERSQETPEAATRRLAAEVRTRGWIIYAARSNRGDWDLFVCRPDGSELRNITETPGFSEAAPQFSRDGRKLLYRRLPRDEVIDGNHYGTQGELVLASSNGSNPMVLGGPGELSWASWSPDGSQIACLAIKGISIVDIDTRRVVRTLPRQGFFQQTTWSPDGKWLLGVANSFGASWSVGRMELASGKASPVSGADCCTPDWIADGRTVIYSNRPAGQASNRGYGWTQLWMADADGQNQRLVYGEDGRHVYGGHASPDGKYVLFTGNVQENGDPSHHGAPMGLMRLADAPIIAGRSTELRQRHPGAKEGPVLTLPPGWEPCWTFAEIDFGPAAPAAGASVPPRDTKAGSSKVASGVAQLAAEVGAKGWIVFSAQSEQGDWDLFLVRPDGSRRRQITRTHDFHEAGARFSADGKRMLFYRMPRNEAVDNNTYGTFDLVIANADGSAAVSYGKGFSWASWGPDGTRLACLDRRGVFIIDVASRQELRRLPRQGIVQQLVWSPDGQWFAGTANGLGPYWNIGRMNVESGEIQAVSEIERYNCTPDWMPDSRGIVYARGIVPETGGHAELWLAEGDRRERRMLYAEGKRHIYGGCASPDGKYLLFTRSAADLGPVANSRTSMSIVRLADTPMIAGTSESFNRKYPTARHGPRLDLSWGWEPHWTYAEIRDASTPGR
ncbi:MAG: hypothetical protein ACP5XB_16635 [Isosphaeraceae bacterium]